jgi:N-acetyl sugar amidotransferase
MPMPAVVECRRCIMNTTADPAIRFDAAGVCSHCQRYDRLIGTRTLRGEAGRRALEQRVDGIRRAGRGREYDCIVGVSGGVDSTYVAWLVRELGLRPLAIHFDNGWDSELAVGNIERVLRHLGIDLYTYVVDWPEFRDLQLAFLRASVPDGEIPTDHGIFATLWTEAARRGIRHIVSGMNFATEAVSVSSWSYGHQDWRYIRDVHRRFGSVPLRTYPHYSLARLGWMSLARGVRSVSILNYVDYRRATAMQLLQERLGWLYYGGKHHESVYTRFWQGYVLPRKFGVDKRYGHLSDLINSGQMTREQALAEIAGPPYPEEEQQQDLRYVTKKLGLTLDEFAALMALPVRSYRDYRNSFERVERLKKLVNVLRRRGLYAR